MSVALEKAVADFSRALTDDNEALGIEAIGSIVLAGIGALDRIATALETLAAADR